MWLRYQTKQFYLRKEDSQLIKGGTQLLVECKKVAEAGNKIKGNTIKAPRKV